jgi:exopolyphosphatase/guanosine-5'-triphosphate,3'-diphosphate pyrophosphatase
MARKKTIAALDVGSHEIRLKIAELNREAAPRELETVCRTLAIGTDTYKSGRISADVLQACISVLDGFVTKLREYRVSEVRSVATSAFREACNLTYVLDQIDRVCGIPIEVLSNAEERYYHMIAAAGTLPNFPALINQGTLLLDIGAGSIQVTVYDKGQYIFSQNMLLGSLRIRELLADLERRTADFGSLLEEYISSDLENYRMLEPKGTSYQNLVVLGGDTSYLKKMAGLPPDQYIQLSSQQFADLYQSLLKANPLDLALEKDIPSEHASLLLPSAMMISKFFSFTGVKSVHLPSATLCDGLLFDMARKRSDYVLSHDPDTDIVSACRQLARRYKVNRRHAEFVEKIALQMFDETLRLHRLKERPRLLLQLAAILHDVGKYVNMSLHNVRSYNIILSAEIIGLDGIELEMVAWLARFYTGEIVYDEHGQSNLTSDRRLQIAKLAAILRLADSLDSGHHQKILSVETWIEDDEYIIQVETNADITLEQWSLEQKESLFQSVYGLTPRLKIRRQKL